MKEVKHLENSTFVSVSFFLYFFFSLHLHAWKVAPCDYPALFPVRLFPEKTTNISSAIDHMLQQSECGLKHRKKKKKP